MKPLISQVCTLPWPVEEELRGFAQAACPGVELWWGKVEQFLQNHPLEQFRDLLQQHGLEAPVASYQGGLFSLDSRAYEEHWAHFLCRLKWAQALGVQVLVVAADASGQVGSEEVKLFVHRLRQAAQAAAQHHLRLALEPQARSSFGNNLQTVLALVAEVDHPHLGVCLDAMHFFLGPSKTEDLHLLQLQQLFHVQLCDVAGVVRELARDADRILPGEGDFPIPALVEHLHRLGYQGPVSLELMNPQLWQVPVLQMVEVGITCLRRLLGQAQMPSGSQNEASSGPDN